jgi:hypothetical protein
VNLSDVAIATMTRVRDPNEEQSVRRSLSALVAAGAPLAISDRGSSTRFVDWMRHLPSVTVIRRSDSLVGQVRASLAAAADTGRPFILYTEPDKRDFFKHHLAGFVERASGARTIGVQLAARSEPAFTTFPPFQRLAEANASALCQRMIGTDTDYFYGPFLVRRELSRLPVSASSDLGWGWRPFLFVAARRLGYRVIGLPGDFECPRDQRRETRLDQEHRLMQFSDNMRGLLDGVALKRTMLKSRI